MTTITRYSHLACIKLVYLLVLFLLLSVGLITVLQAETDDALVFSDSLLEEELVYPDWFKLSDGDLRADLDAAIAAKKRGLIVYFGQKRCAYCDQFMEQNLGSESIQRYLRQHFDIVPIDIWGIETLLDTDGKAYSERELAIHYETNFTPSLVFYNAAGKPVFRLRGFYPPYKFRAALEYVAEGFYDKETFRDYLARAEPGVFFVEGGMNARDFFVEPPYHLNQLVNKDKPLVVLFEQGNCHACDLLHTGPLNKPEVTHEINNMLSVQLDMWSDTAVVTPDGRRTTAKNWAAELGLFHAPTLVFFSPAGKEIIRIDSIVQFYRLWGVLNYMNRRGYEAEMDYQTWRLKQREIK